MISDSPTSQYRNKKNIALAKKWARRNGITIIWICTETGHGKGPMDGVGGSMKRTIDDVLSFHPEDVIRDAETLLYYLPVSSIQMSIYTRDDVLAVQRCLPKKKNDLVLIVPKGAITISKMHEVLIPSSSEDEVFWKHLSSDPDYARVVIKIKRYVFASFYEISAVGNYLVNLHFLRNGSKDFTHFLHEVIGY